MKFPRRQLLHRAAGAAALPAVSRLAWAQAFPTRPVRIIVPFAPAGASDIIGRLIGQWLSERLGQPIIVENRPGAGTNIGTEAVVRAPPDGYTLLMASSANTINATFYDRLNFNFIRDIAPVASINPIGCSTNREFVWLVSTLLPPRSESVSGRSTITFLQRTILLSHIFRVACAQSKYPMMIPQPSKSLGISIGWKKRCEAMDTAAAHL